eukprot:3411455-Rhodomonas_salina.3
MAARSGAQAEPCGRRDSRQLRVHAPQERPHPRLRSLLHRLRHDHPRPGPLPVQSRGAELSWSEYVSCVSVLRVDGPGRWMEWNRRHVLRVSRVGSAGCEDHFEWEEDWRRLFVGVRQPDGHLAVLHRRRPGLFPGPDMP